jgi:hypothetical protein
LEGAAFILALTGGGLGWKKEIDPISSDLSRLQDAA